MGRAAIWTHGPEPATIRPVNDHKVITAAGRPDLTDAMRRLGASPWPEFLLGHDEVVNRLWDRLYELWPDYQFALADPDGDDLIAVGNCLPIRWDGNPATLPPGGIDAVLENGVATVEAVASAPASTVASALMIVVAPDRLGLGLSAACLGVMRGIVADHGLASLVAPVRPTEKHRYPLIAMERYASRRRGASSRSAPWRSAGSDASRSGARVPRGSPVHGRRRSRA